MLIEAVQTIHGWLTDGSTGVNALRTSVPRFSGDAAPPAVTVVQMFRDPEAARGQAPVTGLPVLEVSLSGDPASERAPAVRPFPMDADVQVQVRYITGKTTATDVALRQAALTLRCAVRAIATRAVGGLSVNSVQIVTVSDVRTLAMFAADGDTITTGAMVLTLRVRDLWTHPQ